MKSKKDKRPNNHEEAFMVPSHETKETPPKKKIERASEDKANHEKVFRVPSHEKNAKTVKKGSNKKK